MPDVSSRLCQVQEEPFDLRSACLSAHVCAGSDIVPRVDLKSACEFVKEVADASPLRRLAKAVSEGFGARTAWGSHVARGCGFHPLTSVCAARVSYQLGLHCQVGRTCARAAYTSGEGRSPQTDKSLMQA